MAAERVNDVARAMEKNASLPHKALALPNSIGLATGVWMDVGGFVCISLPGVPKEMKHMLEETVLPRLRTRYQLSPLVRKKIHTLGLRESVISRQLADFEASLPPFISLSYLPRIGTVSLVLSLTPGRSDGDENPLKRFQQAHETLLQALDGHVYGTGDEDSLERAMNRLLLSRGFSTATAESCTGGAVAAALTKTSGSSAYFKGGVVVYHEQAKGDFLGVPQELIRDFGAVSQRVAIEMAEGIRRQCRTHVGLAITGFLEAADGNPDPSTGMAFIALASKEGTPCEKKDLEGHARGQQKEGYR